MGTSSLEKKRAAFQCCDVHVVAFHTTHYKNRNVHSSGPRFGFRWLHFEEQFHIYCKFLQKFMLRTMPFFFIKILLQEPPKLQ